MRRLRLQLLGVGIADTSNDRLKVGRTDSHQELGVRSVVVLEVGYGVTRIEGSNPSLSANPDCLSGLKIQIRTAIRIIPSQLNSNGGYEQGELTCVICRT